MLQFVHQSFQLLKDEPAEAVTEETGVRAGKSTVVELILENEEKCSEKMKRDPPHSRSGRQLPVLTFSFCGMVCVVDVSAFQVSTVDGTGTAGCAGTTPRLEPTPPKTAQRFSATLNNQVCKQAASLFEKLFSKQQ